MIRRVIAAGLTVGLAGAAAACSFLLDTSQNQCNTTADCVNRGGAFATMQCVDQVCVGVDAGGMDAAPEAEAGPWSCLGSVTFPTADASTVSVTVPLVDLSTQKPVTSGLNALLCAKIDPTCSTPLGATVPNSMGLLQFSGLTPPFDGYVLIVPIVPDGGAPDAGDSGTPDLFVPSLVYFNPPIVRDTLYTTTILVKVSALGMIAAAESTPLDLDSGAVFMEAVDCEGKPAAGVSVVIDSTGPLTKGFYFMNSVPVTTSSSTDPTGYAGFVNVPLGARTVTGTLQATGQRIGTATVFTGKSVISYTTLAPSP